MHPRRLDGAGSNGIIRRQSSRLGITASETKRYGVSMPAALSNLTFGCIVTRKLGLTYKSLIYPLPSFKEYRRPATVGSRILVSEKAAGQNSDQIRGKRPTIEGWRKCSP